MKTDREGEKKYFKRVRYINREGCQHKSEAFAKVELKENDRRELPGRRPDVNNPSK